MRTFIRENGSTSVDFLEQEITTEVLGWFNNQYNVANGWIVVALDEFEKAMLENASIDHSNVFRVMVDDRTSLCRINSKTQTYAFVDNLELIETGMIRFERAESYRSLYIDDANSILAEGHNNA